jgi:hypothetical protein
MRRSLLASAAILLLSGAGLASEAGPHPYVSYTASGGAMGNAVVSLPAHPSNIWTNPAGLAFQKGMLFYAAPHDEVSGYRDDIRDRIFAASAARGSGQGLGAAFILRQNSDQPYDTNHDRVPDGTTDILEPAIHVGYGRMLVGPYAAGISILGYQQRADADLLDGDATAGLTAGILRVWDHALRGRLPLEMRWGLAVGNVGPSFDLGRGTADLPLNVRTGFSTKWEKSRLTHIVCAGDLYYLPRELGDEDRRFGGGLGAELFLSGTAAVRVGYAWDRERDRSDATYGFGVGNEIYPHVGGMIEYAHTPGEGDFADHVGVRVYYIP